MLIGVLVAGIINSDFYIAVDTVTPILFLTAGLFADLQRATIRRGIGVIMALGLVEVLRMFARRATHRTAPSVPVGPLLTQWKFGIGLAAAFGYPIVGFATISMATIALAGQYATAWLLDTTMAMFFLTLAFTAIAVMYSLYSSMASLTQETLDEIGAGVSRKLRENAERRRAAERRVTTPESPPTCPPEEPGL